MTSTTDPKRDPRVDLLDAIDATYAYGVLGYDSPEALLAAYDAAAPSSGRAALLHETADAGLRDRIAELLAAASPPAV